MIRPPYLKQGDCIALISASRFIDAEALEKAVRFLEGNHFRVKTGPNILEKYHQFAGTDQMRAADFNWALADKEIKAILFFRGGYGAAKIVDLIDWELLKRAPKWICGYSDITAIHSQVHCLGISSLHCTMPVHLNATDEETIVSFHALMEVLKGETISYNLSYKDRSKASISGPIIGGNLSVLYSVLGANVADNWDNKILFLEDLDEYLYHIDRMMNALSRAKKLEHLKAIVAGSFSDMRDNPVPFGKNALQIIAYYAEKHGIPFFYDFPAGHQPLNLPIKLGEIVEIKAGEMVYSH